MARDCSPSATFDFLPQKFRSFLVCKSIRVAIDFKYVRFVFRCFFVWAAFCRAALTATELNQVFFLRLSEVRICALSTYVMISTRDRNSTVSRCAPPSIIDCFII